VRRRVKGTPPAVGDFGSLEALWRERARRVAAARGRANPEGMTRPPRDPDERAWLAERGRLGPFVEAEASDEASGPSNGA
jgi:hypothetical protein